MDKEMTNAIQLSIILVVFCHRKPLFLYLQIYIKGYKPFDTLIFIGNTVLPIEQEALWAKMRSSRRSK